jgi:predicted NAD/FAD-dependent oxidoreductase
VPTGVETRIDQLITVDHEELAWIAYDVTWTASGPPTAEVLSVQRDSPQEQQHEEQQQQQHHLVTASAPPLTEEPASFLSVNSWNSETSYAPYASYVPRSQEPIAYSPYSSLGGSSNGDQHYTHYSSVLFS